MEYLYNKLYGIVETGITDILNICATNPYINTFVIFSFLCFSKITSTIYNKKQNMNNWAKTKFPYLYVAINAGFAACQSSVLYIHSFFYKYRVEPKELEWTNISAIDMVDQDRHNCKLVETYNLYNSDKINDSIQLFNEIYLKSTTNQFIQNIQSSPSNLLIVKLDNIYLYREINTSTNNLYNTTPSTVKFLSIVYTHPQLEHAIYIDIPKNARIRGNEILSATFILRYLEYQSMPYIFDLGYTLNIIDNRVNQFQLNCNQYIILQEDGYIIKTLS